MKLKKYLKAINYDVTGGNSCRWSCFGKNVRFIDTHESSCVYDSVTNQVYMITTGNETMPFIWVDAEYRDAYIEYARSIHIDPFIAWSDIVYQEVPRNRILDIVERSLWVADSKLDNMMDRICNDLDTYENNSCNCSNSTVKKESCCNNQPASVKKGKLPSRYSVTVSADLMFDVSADSEEDASAIAMKAVDVIIDSAIDVNKVTNSSLVQFAELTEFSTFIDDVIEQ